MLALAAKLALAPLWITQAVLTRSRLPRLPEAEGERAGRAGPARAPALRLLVAGDSSAAGVGVRQQDEALAAPLAQQLAVRLGGAVQWQLLASSGLTTAQLRERVCDEHAAQATPWDVAVVVSGVNDVIDQVPSHHAVAARDALVNELRNRHGVRHVAFAPLPPVHRFPSLPQPLRWVAGADAERHNTAMREWATTREDVSCVRLALTLDETSMAHDGFHPGAPAYRHIAEAIAEHLVQRLAKPASAHGSRTHSGPR